MKIDNLVNKMYLINFNLRKMFATFILNFQVNITEVQQIPSFLLGS